MMTEDILRFTVLALTAIVIGVVLVVVRLHYRAWRRAPRPLGLVPLHVWTISVAHILLAVSAALGVIRRVGEDIQWYIVIPYIAGCGFTLFALTVVARFQNRRVTESRIQVTVVETSDIQVDGFGDETESKPT